MADVKNPTNDRGDQGDRKAEGKPGTAGANAAVPGAIKPDSRAPAPATSAGGVETRSAPRTATPADAAPGDGARKSRPWRVPTPPSGTANTPSCNPNYRPPPAR